MAAFATVGIDPCDLPWVVSVVSRVFQFNKGIEAREVSLDLEEAGIFIVFLKNKNFSHYTTLRSLGGSKPLELYDSYGFKKFSKAGANVILSENKRFPEWSENLQLEAAWRLI